jgi:hypothetical protein
MSTAPKIYNDSDNSSKAVQAAIKLLHQAITLLRTSVYCTTGMVSLEMPVQPKINVSSRKKDAFDYSDDFEKAWSLYPKRPNNNKKLAWRAWNARVNEDGIKPEVLIAALKKYREYAKTLESKTFIMQASTFFGPSRRFEDDFSIEKQHDPSRTIDQIRKEYRVFD